MNGDCNLWICFDLFLKTLVFFLGGVCDGSPVLPATAGQWVCLGDSSRELCTPVLPSTKGALAPVCVWSLFILDFVITLNLVLSDALTNDVSDRNCV